MFTFVLYFCLFQFFPQLRDPSTRFTGYLFFLFFFFLFFSLFFLFFFSFFLFFFSFSLSPSSSFFIPPKKRFILSCATVQCIEFNFFSVGLWHFIAFLGNFLLVRLCFCFCLFLFFCFCFVFLLGFYYFPFLFISKFLFSHDQQQQQQQQPDTSEKEKCPTSKNFENKWNWLL